MKKKMSKYKAIGLRIKNARKKADISQEELAKKLGYISATAVSLIEAGQRKISIVDLEKVAEVLKCTVDFLLDKEKEEVDIKFALRTNKKISHEDKKKILNFIEFAEESYGKRRK